VILTSNRTRELHEALKRRCLYHWIDHPSAAREAEIVRARVEGVPERLSAQASAFVAALRRLELIKVPGVAETLDWVESLSALDREELDRDLVDATLGAVLKEHEDLEQVRGERLEQLLAEARSGGAG
jgi:MoxR-like ATPase